jgi:hypothetical protein
MKSYICYILFYYVLSSRHQTSAFTSPLTSNVVDRRIARRDVAMMDISGGTSAAIDEADNADEIALLLPGQTLRIQIGDVSSSRKAWKKRRRNSSPILIPCSILGMNREWMVRWNVMTLLHQVGEESPAADGAVAISAGKLGRAYKKRLGGDLQAHADALGYDSVESLLQALFDERVQAEYGVSTFVEPNHGNLMLMTGLTRRQARSFSSSAGMVQFRVAEENEKMIHTGLASVRLSSSIGRMPKFSQEVLGAALRVSPYDEAAEKYQQGDELNAFVYSYEVAGDNESPLLVLTADDPRGKGIALGGTGTFGSSTRVFKRRNTKGGNFQHDTYERELSYLSAGEGPISATVVAVSSHSNAVFVDCGVGRKRGKRYGGGTTKVLGMLRLEDIEGEMDFEAGDKIDVYIKAVSPQSGRYMVTQDSSIKNKKQKDLKMEKEADKRKDRLSSKFSLDMSSVIGNEYDGVVKAKSKSGDWCYVQPIVGEEEGFDLPVGVANILEGNESDTSYSSGDSVRVRVEGIDEKRGQLSLILLN